MLLFTLIAATLLCSAQPPRSNAFTLSGHLKGSPAKMIYLQYKDAEGKNVTDSCGLENGRFSFHGHIDEPTMALLKTNRKIIPDDENLNITEVFLEPAAMTASLENDKFRDIVLTGSATHIEYEEVKKQRDYINKTFTDSLSERHSAFSEQYILKNPGSYLSVYELSFYRGRWPNNMVQYLYNRFPVKYRESKYGQYTKSYLDAMKDNAEGRPAKAFSALDVQGKELRLSDFKGRYVLLDFWGSWCVPCRASNPHLIELYKKYSGKGFEIIGIATEYDKTDSAWRKAIQQDGIGLWHNILSSPIAGPPAEGSPTIAGQFSVHVFPTKILIDPCGYIIGRFNGGDNDAKLDELLSTIYH